MVERIPPRVAIRRDASIEIPHVMLLINDEDKTVIEPITRITDKLSKLYDFDLIQNSGHIKGYALRESDVAAVNDSLKAILDKSTDGLLFAVGDGNHSLATAKAHWDNLKQTLSEEERMNLLNSMWRNGISGKIS